jgi:hypothetical protein
VRSDEQPLKVRLNVAVRGSAPRLVSGEHVRSPGGTKEMTSWVTRNYASPAASQRPVQDSRSGWSRLSFPVGLFHPLQHAGLSRLSVPRVARRVEL